MFVGLCTTATVTLFTLLTNIKFQKFKLESFEVIEKFKFSFPEFSATFSSYKLNA